MLPGAAADGGECTGMAEDRNCAGDGLQSMSDGCVRHGRGCVRRGMVV